MLCGIPVVVSPWAPRGTIIMVRERKVVAEIRVSNDMLETILADQQKALEQALSEALVAEGARIMEEALGYRPARLRGPSEELIRAGSRNIEEALSEAFGPKPEAPSLDVRRAIRLREEEP